MRSRIHGRAVQRDRFWRRAERVARSPAGPRPPRPRSAARPARRRVPLVPVRTAGGRGRTLRGVSAVSRATRSPGGPPNRARREAARVRAPELLRDHPRLQAQRLILRRPRPNANDRAWRSGACEPFSTRPDRDRSFASMPEQRTTNASGAPVAGDEHSLTVGPNGPTALQDAHVVQKTKERIMSSPNGVGSDAPPTNPASGIQRLLFVSDAAVADVDELPPVVRAIIDAATEVNVLTPTLPGRLAWLADDVDRFRHYADERLDTVLNHLHAIGADAGGALRGGSVLTVIADAVTAFEPDHILIALHVSEHANWQERRLIEHVENRFRLPVATFAVDPAGHTRTADGPLPLCYDGSEDAKHAIEHAGRVLGGRDALVVTVRQPTPALGSSASAGGTDSTFDVVKVDRAAADFGERVAREGVRIAQHAGLRAQPVAVEATGPVWKTIVEIADRHDAATIVMGSRGLTGLRPMLPGSVSRAIVHHADRPTLIIRQPTHSPQSA